MNPTKDNCNVQNCSVQNGRWVVRDHDYPGGSGPMKPNPHAVALGRKGGKANTKAQKEARAKNGKYGGYWTHKRNLGKRPTK